MRDDPESSYSAAKPPVALGLFLVAAFIMGVIFVGACAAIYLDSGADTGEMVLNDFRAYAPGSYEYVGERNYFIVRLPDATFLALVDLDAANRATPARRCRVQPVPPDDRSFAGIIDQYGRRISAQAGGWQHIFRENCNGAIYDAAGIRLDADGRNLDRFPATINADGQLVVDVSKRECSVRGPSNPYQTVPCT